MKKTALIAAAAALATISTGASAAYVSNINSLAGSFAITGFKDLTPNSYSVSLTGLVGNGVLTAGPSNTYALYGTIIAGGETYTGLLLSGTPKSFGSALTQIRSTAALC